MGSLIIDGETTMSTKDELESNKVHIHSSNLYVPGNYFSILIVTATWDAILQIIHCLHCPDIPYKH